MRINIAKLEANGFIVDQNRKDGIIHIHPAGGNTELFNAVCKTLSTFDVYDGARKAEELVMRINDEKIMQLSSDI